MKPLLCAAALLALTGCVDFPLASMYAHVRSLRFADGPDEVHKMTIARQELRRHREAAA